MAEEPLITEEMRAAVGVESEPWTLEVDKTMVRMFARAVGYTDPLFYDEAFAQSKGYRSLPAAGLPGVGARRGCQRPTVGLPSADTPRAPWPCGAPAARWATRAECCCRRRRTRACLNP